MGKVNSGRYPLTGCGSQARLSKFISLLVGVWARQEPDEGAKKYFSRNGTGGTVGRNGTGTAYAKIRCPRFFSFMRK